MGPSRRARGDGAQSQNQEKRQGKRPVKAGATAGLERLPIRGLRGRESQLSADKVSAAASSAVCPTVAPPRVQPAHRRNAPARFYAGAGYHKYLSCCVVLIQKKSATGGRYNPPGCASGGLNVARQPGRLCSQWQHFCLYTHSVLA